MQASSSGAEDGSWQSEALGVARAAAGGLLFGVPLLYTMEVWWIGTQVRPVLLLGVLAFLATVLLVLNLTAGFRTTPDVLLRDAAADTVEALAIGIVITAGVLFMLREVTLSTPLQAALGMVLYESIPFCLGIGVARYLLSGDTSLDTDDSDNSGSDTGGSDTRGSEPGSSSSSDAAADAVASSGRGAELKASLAEVGAAVLGATFIGLSIAPTEEVPMLASAMDPAWQLVVIVASLLTSYAIVFVAGFAGQEDRRAQEGVFQDPIVETIVSYLAAFVVAAALLWLFRRDVSPPSDLLARTVVLAFPAAIGGAVGRLAL